MFILTLLLIVLLLISIFSLVITKRDFLSITFLTSVIFSLGTVFSLLGNNKWRVQINPITFLIIFVSICFIGLGEIIVKSNYPIHLEKRNYMYIKNNKKINILILFIALIVVYFSYKKLLEIAVIYGYSGNGSFLPYARNALLFGGYSIGYGLTILQYFILGLGFYSIFIFINNSMLYNGIRKKLIMNWSLLIILIPLVLINILTTARNGFIMIIVYILASFILISMFYGKKISVPSLFLKIMIGLIVFLSIFTFLGLSSGKILIDSFLDSIYLYGGSPIIALNEFLEAPVYNDIIGLESFTGIRGLLNRFFPNVNPGAYFLPSIAFENGTYTNIYTSFRSYIADFRFIGLFMIQFLIAFSYTFLVRFVLNRNTIKNVLFPIIPFFVYYVLYQLFAATITYALFSITQIFLFTFLVVFHLLSKKIRCTYKGLL